MGGNKRTRLGGPGRLAGPWSWRHPTYGAMTLMEGDVKISHKMRKLPIRAEMFLSSIDCSICSLTAFGVSLSYFASSFLTTGALCRDYRQAGVSDKR